MLLTCLIVVNELRHAELAVYVLYITVNELRHAELAVYALYITVNELRHAELAVYLLYVTVNFHFHQQMCADDRWLLAVAFIAELWGITEHSIYCRVVAVQSGVRAVTLDDGRPFEG